MNIGLGQLTQSAQVLGVSTGGQWDPSSVASANDVPPGMYSAFQKAATAGSYGQADAAFQSALQSIAVAAASIPGGLPAAIAIEAMGGLGDALVAIWPAKGTPDPCVSGGTLLLTWSWANQFGNFSPSSTPFEQYLYGIIQNLFPPDGTVIDQCKTPIDIYGPASPAMLVATLTAAINAWNLMHSATSTATLTRSGLNTTSTSNGRTTFNPPPPDPVSVALYALAVATGVQGTISFNYNAGPQLAVPTNTTRTIPSCQQFTMNWTMTDSMDTPLNYLFAPWSVSATQDSSDPSGASWNITGFYSGSSGISIVSTAKFTINSVQLMGPATTGACAHAIVIKPGGFRLVTSTAGSSKAGTPAQQTSMSAGGKVALGTALVGSLAVGGLYLYARKQHTTMGGAMRSIFGKRSPSVAPSRYRRRP